MKKIKLFPLILIFCLAMVWAAPSASALREPNVQAAAAVLVDLDTGQVLYSKNPDSVRAPASLTKVMTALLTFEAIERGEAALDDRVVAQDDCRKGMIAASSTSGIVPGVETSLRELLYCALLQSANEACNIIGRYLAGSISGFVDRMNERAKELGCEHTHFMNPNGMSATDHYSSAYDLYLITKEALKFPDFVDMVNTLSYQPESDKVNGGRTIYNTNALLTDSSTYGKKYLYEYASGVKTGYTRAAGYCLISTASKDGLNLLAVVLGCSGLLNANINEYRNFSSSITLYDWAFGNFAYQTLVTEGERLATVDVAEAKNGQQALLCASEGLTLLLPTDLTEEDVVTEVTLYSESLSAPLAAGAVVGQASVQVKGEEKAVIELYNSMDITLGRAEYFSPQPEEETNYIWGLGTAAAMLLVLLVYLLLVQGIRRRNR